MSKKALSHLRRDPHFAEIIEATTLRGQSISKDVYVALLRTIIYQQLSGKAAATIHGRFLELFQDGYPAAKKLVRMKIPTLRAVGLSNQKSQYVQNAAQFWLDNDVETTDWNRLSDEEVVEWLTQIKGVGVWSARILLMFTLDRPDVFPNGDLGIRNAIIKKYRLRSKGKSLDRRIEKIADAWRPHRTLACRYLWSWLDNR